MGSLLYIELQCFVCTTRYQKGESRFVMIREGEDGQCQEELAEN